MRLLLPKLSEISGELKAINSRIDSVETLNKSLETNMNNRFKSLEDIIDIRFASMDEKIVSKDQNKDKISGLRTEMSLRLDSLEKRIPVIEELTALKIRIADMEARMAKA